MPQSSSASTVQERFRAIVIRARLTNPFYARWIPRGGPVPVLRRAALLDNNDEVLNGHPVTARTSGSTGMPVRISQSPARMKLENADTRRFIHWLGGLLPCVRIIHPRGNDAGKPMCLDIKTPIDEQAAFLERCRREHAAQAVTTYPTNALLLAQYVLDNSTDTRFIRRLGLISEAIDPGQRAFIQSAFPNARLWVNYSSMEFGMISCQCPNEPGFQHIMAHKLRVEILDDADNPCPPGTPGRVVITDYFNDWSPLIRYEIGDLASRRPCPCGKIRLPSFEAVHGKVRGALLHRSGQRVLFADLSVALRDLPGIRQYQVIQEATEDFVVKIVRSPNATDFDAPVAAVFEKHFGYLPRIRLEYPTAIPREANGKFHASICRV